MRPVPGQKEGFSKLLTISSANIDWISKILSRTYRYSPRNLQWRDHEIYQYTLSVSLHYLVKWMYSDFASIAVAATADRVRCGRLIGTKTRLLISQENQLQICNSFNTLDSTAWYSTDPLFTAILVWRDTCCRSDWSSSQCKTHILKTVAEWCYLHLIHWWKKSSHTEKINRMTADCKHLCHQRRKPFQQNVFFRTRMTTWISCGRYLCLSECRQWTTIGLIFINPASENKMPCYHSVDLAMPL